MKILVFWTGLQNKLFKKKKSKLLDKYQRANEMISFGRSMALLIENNAKCTGKRNESLEGHE